MLASSSFPEIAQSPADSHPWTGARHGGFRGWEPALPRVPLPATQLTLDFWERGGSQQGLACPSSCHSCIITVRLCTFLCWIEKFVGSSSLVYLV